MQRRLSAAFAAGVLAALGAAPACAQSYPDIESAALITDRHVTRFDRETVSRQGNFMVFTVNVAWKGPDERPESEPSLRVMKYLTKCDAQELAVASVAVFDKQRALVKSFGIAPGGWDFEKPARDSEAFDWMKRACSHPLAW
ncbi:MAG: hypothetical protein MUF30_04170 [Burkholderiales bacterium]|jgi:hypothetical protein|nr:hypothetical protein [Burkholderiales bacterium]